MLKYLRNIVRMHNIIDENCVINVAWRHTPIMRQDYQCRIAVRTILSRKVSKYIVKFMDRECKYRLAAVCPGGLPISFCCNKIQR